MWQRTIYSIHNTLRSKSRGSPVGVRKVLRALLKAGKQWSAALHQTLIHPLLTGSLGSKERVMRLRNMDGQKVF